MGRQKRKARFSGIAIDIALELTDTSNTRHLLRCAASKYLGHFPEGLIEFHILIDAFDCPALGHPGTIRAAARTVTLTTANDVFLDAVQGGPKIFGSVSITSWIKEHGGTYGGFPEVFPAISRRASGES
jgi:hypothetical protein